MKKRVFESIDYYYENVKKYLDEGWSFSASAAKVGLKPNINTNKILEHEKMKELKDYYIKKTYGPHRTSRGYKLT